MSRRVLLPAIALACALVSAAAPVVHAGAFDVTRVTLRNGLRVVLAPDSTSTAVDAALWFPAGSRHEKPTQQGLALLAARLAFRAGEDDALAPLTAVGGTGALVSTPDYTSFSATVPADAWERALSFLATRAAVGATRAQDVTAEREAIRADRTRLERAPVTEALAKLWATTWPGHPYARTGAAPSVGAENLSASDVEGWRRSRLGLSNAVLTIVGGFDPDSVLAVVHRRLESLPRSGSLANLPLPTPRTPGRGLERMDLPVRLCLVGWRAPAADDPDAPALELLASWLGSGAGSHLASALVNDWHVAVDAQAGVVAQQAGSLLWTLAVVAPDADSTAVETTLLDAVRGVTREAPDAASVERARRTLMSTMGFALQTARQRAQVLGEGEQLVGEGATLRRFQALHRITPADLQRVAARVMTDANRAVLWIVPRDGGAR